MVIAETALAPACATRHGCHCCRCCRQLLLLLGTLLIVISSSSGATKADLPRATSAQPALMQERENAKTFIMRQALKASNAAREDQLYFRHQHL